MRIIKSLFAVIAAMLFFTSCGPSSPSDVVRDATEYMYAGEVEEYLKLIDATTEQKDLLRDLYNDKGKKKLEEKGKLLKIEIKEETISEDGKSSTVEFELIFESGEIDAETAELVLADDKWLIKNPFGNK